MLDEGRLTDGKGRTVDFRNTVLIMTSNVASDLIQEMVQREGDDHDALEGQLMEALRRTFRPEFLNRIDEIVTFHSLGRDEIAQIVDIQLRELQKRLADRKLTLDLTDEAKAQLAERGYDPVFGARPLKRTIQRMIENPMAVQVLGGYFTEGDHILVEPDGETFTFRKDAPATVAS